MCNLYLCCGHTIASEQSTLHMLRGTWLFSDINILLFCVISCFIYVSCHWPIREHPHVWKYFVGHIISRGTKLWPGQPGNCFRIPNSSQRYVLFQSIQPGSEAHYYCCSAVSRRSFWGYIGHGLKPTTRFHIVTRLRVHRAICLDGMHSICTFILCCCHFYSSHINSSNMHVLK
jgi:hypothetical protein